MWIMGPEHCNWLKNTHRKPQKKARLANTWITDKQKFEKIITTTSHSQRHKQRQILLTLHQLKTKSPLYKKGKTHNSTDLLSTSTIIERNNLLYWRLNITKADNGTGLHTALEGTLYAGSRRTIEGNIKGTNCNKCQKWMNAWKDKGKYYQQAFHPKAKSTKKSGTTAARTFRRQNTNDDDSDYIPFNIPNTQTMANKITNYN